MNERADKMTNTPASASLIDRLVEDLSRPSSAAVHEESQERLRAAVAQSHRHKTHLPVTGRGTSPVCQDTGMVAFSVQSLSGHVFRLRMCAEDFDWIVQGIEDHRRPRPDESFDDILKPIDAALARHEAPASPTLRRAFSCRRPCRWLWIDLNSLIAMNRRIKERVTDRLGRLNL